MNASPQDHWQAVYRDKADPQTSWYRPHLEASLRRIDALDLPRDAPVIDVGGGRSTLVDDLLDRGFSDITVLDISEAALDQSRARLGAQASAVHWQVADITEVELPLARYALWHDRAVFHFLTRPASQRDYALRAARAVREGGFMVLATFAADGPEQCSGLPVARYEAAALAEIFAPHFELLDAGRELHYTPSGAEQAFTCVVMRCLPGGE